MFINEIEPNFTNIQIADLLKIEEEYHFEFPEEIKEFYLKYNAGKLRKKSVTLKQDEWLSSTKFHGFYSIKYGHSMLEEKLRRNYSDDWWIKWLIPLGYDEGGEDFCFSIRECDYGCIYYFLSDCIDEEYPEDALIKVGDNLVDFINNMT